MLIAHPIISLNKLVPTHTRYPPEIIHGCFFCTPNSENEVLARTANFSLLYDLSPIVEGHLIITSHTHIGCAGEIDPLLHEEYVKLKEIAGKMVKTAYGSATFYEHGRAGHCSTIANSTQKCDHFHLHIVPINLSISAELGKKFMSMSLENSFQIFQFFERYGSYLYFEDDKGQISIYPASDGEVESHLLRTLICEKIGHPERSYWETHQNLEMVNSAIQKYLPIITKLVA